MIGTDQLDEVHTFVEATVRERVSSSVRSFAVDAARAPSGVFTGSLAVHPATGERIPIYVADYVVATYGTGAVMGVPAHDGRHFRFAEAYGLPVVEVIRPVGATGAPTSDLWTGDGVLIDSDRFTGMASDLARDAIAEWLQARGVGRRTVRYRLRDWLISRHHYWGPRSPSCIATTAAPCRSRRAASPKHVHPASRAQSVFSGRREPLDRASLSFFGRRATPAIVAAFAMRRSSELGEFLGEDPGAEALTVGGQSIGTLARTLEEPLVDEPVEVAHADARLHTQEPLHEPGVDLIPEPFTLDPEHDLEDLVSPEQRLQLL